MNSVWNGKFSYDIGSVVLSWDIITRLAIKLVYYDHDFGIRRIKFSTEMDDRSSKSQGLSLKLVSLNHKSETAARPPDEKTMAYYVKPGYYAHLCPSSF